MLRTLITTLPMVLAIGLVGCFGWFLEDSTNKRYREARTDQEEAQVEVRKARADQARTRAEILRQYRDCLKRSEVDESVDCAQYEAAVATPDRR